MKNRHIQVTFSDPSNSPLMALATKRVVYLTAAIFLILAIMSHTSSCCQAGEEGTRIAPNASFFSFCDVQITN
jgi:hypothetical protein